MLNLYLYKSKDDRVKESYKQQILTERGKLQDILEEYDEEFGYLKEEKAENFFEKIKMVFITFQSMETKKLVQEHLFRSDGVQSTAEKKLNFHSNL